MDANKWGGAIDLSQVAGGPKRPSNQAQAGGATASAFALLIEETQLGGYLEVSDRLPVILELVTSGEREAAELQQSRDLEQLVDSAGGRLLLLRLALAAQSQLLQALQLSQLPALLLLLKQQPVPLAAGVATGQELAMLLNQVLQLAAKEGLTGTYEPAGGATGGVVPGAIGTDPMASVSSSTTSADQSLTGHHKSAYEALLQEDYEAAANFYRAALKENPGDVEAQAGLAQVSLVQRSLRLPEGALQSNPENLSAAFEQADALFLAAEVAAAFNLLLHWFAKLSGDEREQIRARLLELFLIAGEDPAVPAARRQLSQLLF